MIPLDFAWQVENFFTDPVLVLCTALTTTACFVPLVALQVFRKYTSYAIVDKIRDAEIAELGTCGCCLPLCFSSRKDPLSRRQILLPDSPAA